MVTLAMRRLPPDVKTPAELVTFRVEEWAATDGEGAWGPAFRRWQVARHAWGGGTSGLGARRHARRASR
jgi:hypothetical protein